MRVVHLLVVALGFLAWLPEKTSPLRLTNRLSPNLAVLSVDNAMLKAIVSATTTTATTTTKTTTTTTTTATTTTTTAPTTTTTTTSIHPTPHIIIVHGKPVQDMAFVNHNGGDAKGKEHSIKLHTHVHSITY